mgnify:CR=1 FL=1
MFIPQWAWSRGIVGKLLFPVAKYLAKGIGICFQRVLKVRVDLLEKAKPPGHGFPEAMFLCG